MQERVKKKNKIRTAAHLNIAELAHVAAMVVQGPAQSGCWTWGAFWLGEGEREG